MSREKSQFLSSFGTAFQVFKTITDAVLAAGGGDDDLRKILSERDLAGKIAKVIMDEPQSFKVIVDYGQTLEEMIQDGKYDWVGDDITSDHFPIQGSGKEEKEITLFSFKRSISSDDAIAEMEKTGYRPADPPEILALGAKHSELQKQFPIVALGSPWRTPRGVRFVLALSWDGLERSLALHLFESDWPENYRFAAVPK